MAFITIIDPLKVEIVTANPQPTAGIGKYLRGPAAQLVAASEVVAELKAQLPVANSGESGLRLTWSQSVPLSSTGASLAIDAGTTATIGVYNRSGMELLDKTFVGPAITVPDAKAYVAFGLSATVDIGTRNRIGALSFGCSEGTACELRVFRPFDLAPNPPVSAAPKADALDVAATVKEVLENFVIPNTCDDLVAMKPMPEGTLAYVSGHGEFQIATSVEAAPVFNPLASVDTLPKVGPLTVTPAASATVGVTATLSGGFQLRVQRLARSRLLLSLHRVAGRGFDVTIEARAGSGVTVANADLLSMLFSGPGGVSSAAQTELVAAGITTDQLDRICDVMKSGLSRKLEAGLKAEFSSTAENNAAFVYEIDLDAIDSTSSDAVTAALAGDLRPLNALEPLMPAHGVSIVTSGTKKMRDRKTMWRINLVGIVNAISLTELVRTGTVVHHPDTGELLVVDKISNDRVGAVTNSSQIRRLLYESSVMTLTYKAGGLDTGLDITQSFFAFDKHANRHRVSDYLDAVAAVGLIPAADIAQRLPAGADDFGPTGLEIETTFDHAASERAFGVSGLPPTQEFYERIGRNALLSVVDEGDADAYRRIPAMDDRLWQRMKDAGQHNFHVVLSPPITGDATEALRIAVVAADYTVIVWWAQAMAQAAQSLSDMRAFLNGRKAVDLDHDPEFRARRDALTNAMVKAIRRNTSAFDDPWGVVALFMASAGTASASASILSPRLTLSLPS